MKRLLIQWLLLVRDQLFERGTKFASDRGLILVDTKYEFGIYHDKILLIDEVHTPDSSRYFYSDQYEETFNKNAKQKQLSKEFVREWLMEKGFQGRPGDIMPDMNDEVIESIMNRYVELYEIVTGEKFTFSNRTDLIARLDTTIKTAINSLLK